MNKLEELKALLELASPGPFHLVDENQNSEYRPMWVIQNDARRSDDDDVVGIFDASLHCGCKEDFQLFIAMRELLPQLIAVAEAANAVYQGHKVETGYVEDGYLGGSLATEKALADALTPLTKDADK